MEDNNLRYDIADKRLTYSGSETVLNFNYDRILEFNHRHSSVLKGYDLELKECQILTLSDVINGKSNLGTLRNRRLRQSIILSSALSAVATGLHGCGSLNNYPKKEQTKDKANELKRANDRTAAQVMAETLQTTTRTLPVGEEVLIESSITEGVRVKPGKEVGGNPTIAVGAVFGKKEHQALYGLEMPPNVSLLSMGNDVIDGTTKSVKGLHSSLTALFVTEAHMKRHLPDIYVQRWLNGANFSNFNPREATNVEIAKKFADAYGHSDLNKLSAFFLDRPRHYPAIEELNKASVATPYDKDGDLIPAIVLGLEGLNFSDGRNLSSMIGEIGGSAEWAVGVLPLIWRGGNAIGMLTSQSTLTRTDLSPQEKWDQRFNFTEEEFMMIQDARFERKPYFTIDDILDDPFAGGIASYGAITDNYLVPQLKGVKANIESGEISVNVLTVNSLGIVEIWKMVFKANKNIDHTIDMMACPKEELITLDKSNLEKRIGEYLSDIESRQRFRIFFNNEYYPALIPVRGKMFMLHKAIESLIKRGALNEKDREIVEITERLEPSWFTN